jgi:hypothetical protein
VPKEILGAVFSCDSQLATLLIAAIVSFSVSLQGAGQEKVAASD